MARGSRCSLLHQPEDVPLVGDAVHAYGPGARRREQPAQWLHVRQRDVPDIAEPAGVPAPLPGRAAQPLDSIRPRALAAPAQVGHGETKEVRFEVPGGALAGGGPEE